MRPPDRYRRSSSSSARFWRGSISTARPRCVSPSVPRGRYLRYSSPATAKCGAAAGLVPQILGLLQAGLGGLFPLRLLVLDLAQQLARRWVALHQLQRLAQVLHRQLGTSELVEQQPGLLGQQVGARPLVGQDRQFAVAQLQQQFHVAAFGVEGPGCGQGGRKVVSIDFAGLGVPADGRPRVLVSRVELEGRKGRRNLGVHSLWIHSRLAAHAHAERRQPRLCVAKIPLTIDRPKVDSNRENRTTFCQRKLAVGAIGELAEGTAWKLVPRLIRVLFRPATGTEVLRMLMPCRSRFAAVFPGCLLALWVAGCNTNSTPAPQACCEQPQIPAGVAPFTVVVDEATGPSDGQKVILRVALGKPTKRDDIYPVLHTLYRHAMKRGPFEPIQFIADVYPSEAAAKAAGDTQLLARISRQQSQLRPGL